MTTRDLALYNTSRILNGEKVVAVFGNQFRRLPIGKRKRIRALKK